MSIPEPIALATETEAKERGGRSQAPELREAARREGKGGKHWMSAPTPHTLFPVTRIAAPTANGLRASVVAA